MTGLDLDLPDRDRSPDDPIWTTDELVDRVEHPNLEVRNWAFRRLILQDPETAKDLRSEHGDALGVDTDQYEAVLLDEPGDPESIRTLKEQIYEKLQEEGDLPELEELTPQQDERILSELAQHRELFPDILFGRNDFYGVLILQHTTKCWATDVMMEHLDRLWSEVRPRQIWEVFEELGDPAALPALMDEWKPGEPHASRVVDRLARIAGVEDQLPDRMCAGAEEQRDMVRELESFDAPDDVLEYLRHTPTIKLPLECNQCNRIYTYDVEQVYIHPDHAPEEEQDWNGMLPSRIIHCKHCGAEDDYTWTSTAYQRIQGRIMTMQESGTDEHVTFQPIDLPDGRPVKRPSDGLEALKNRAEQHPQDPDIWHRLGDFALQFMELDDAERAFDRVEELQETDLALRLDRADLSVLRGNLDRAKQRLNEAFEAFVNRSRTDRKAPARHMIHCFENLTRYTEDPALLRATWTGKPDLDDGRSTGNGDRETNRSGIVLLEDFHAWKGLAEFLTFANLQSLQVESTSSDASLTSSLRTYIEKMYDEASRPEEHPGTAG